MSDRDRETWERFAAAALSGMWANPTRSASEHAACASANDMLAMTKQRWPEPEPAKRCEAEASSRGDVKSRPYPGDGYRWVKVGETLCDGDERKDSFGIWHQTKAIGACVLKYSLRRRLLAGAAEELPDPGPNYRWLAVGETLRPGDDLWLNSGWAPIDRPGILVYEEYSYRRHNSVPDPGPGYRWVEPGEALHECDEGRGRYRSWYYTGSAGRILLDEEKFTYRRKMHSASFGEIEPPHAGLSPQIAAKLLSEDTLQRLDKMLHDPGETVTVMEFDADIDATSTVAPETTPSDDEMRISAIVVRMRQTRSNMIGTDDEEHYWDCQKAAEEILRLWQLARHATERGVGAECREPEVSSRGDVTCEPDPGEGYRWVKCGEALQDGDHWLDHATRLWELTNTPGWVCKTTRHYRRRIDAAPETMPSDADSPAPASVYRALDAAHKTIKNLHEEIAALRVERTALLLRLGQLQITKEQDDALVECIIAATQFSNDRVAQRLIELRKMHMPDLIDNGKMQRDDNDQRRKNQESENQESENSANSA